jgi:hypothetical protein
MRAIGIRSIFAVHKENPEGIEGGALESSGCKASISSDDWVVVRHEVRKRDLKSRPSLPKPRAD